MTKCESINIKKKKVANDFKDSEIIFENLSSCVTFFGSARVKESSKYAKDAEFLAYELAKNGINIVTGGGGGIMQAANKGAFNSKNAESLGLNILIPREQSLNPYTTRNFTFNYFFSRKFMLIKHSCACVVFPGGFGTLDELFEVFTLLLTKKIENLKIYLINCDFWKNLILFFKENLVNEGMIEEIDLNIFTLTDDLEFVKNDILDLINNKSSYL